MAIDSLASGGADSFLRTAEFDTKVGEVPTERLVDLAVNGCDDAFARLVEIFRPRLVQLLQRQVGDRAAFADAEDLAQVALVKAYRNLSQYNPEFKFSTWLYTIAFRVAKDNFRQRQRWYAFLTQSPALVSVQADQATQEIEQRDEVENIWRVARRLLSAEQYSAMWLRYGEDMTIAEVSQVLGKSAGNVRVLLHRGRLSMMDYYHNQK